jgi:bifunctional enzyme CysN/CysC
MLDEIGRAAEDIEGYLAAHERKSMLRFLTCGGVDDGKSTLIGQLLYQSQVVFDDHLIALEADSAKIGTQDGDLDFALLVDGLRAEREQGITIDVAYRFLSTERRKFIIVDAPGHDQYTRNMVTGASNADVAVILVDATRGVITQTRRHTCLVSLLGIRKVVLAINKLDLVDYSGEIFEDIAGEYREFADRVSLNDITAIPMSALRGDNIVDPSDHMPWYEGPSLLSYLEDVEIEDRLQARPFRMPVQYVSRPGPGFRGLCGMVVGGDVRPGDAVRVLPSGHASTVSRIVTYDGDLDLGVAGQSITVTLADEIDVSRGDVLVSDASPPAVADQFEADVIWMAGQALVPNRHYLLRLGAQTVDATISHPKYRLDVNTLQRLAADTLELNEIGVCTVTLDRAIPFEPYSESRDMGGFILIDRLTNETAAAGLLRFAVRRAHNVHWQALDVDKRARVALNGHRAAVVWFTGLSGAGKSSIANLVEKRLHAQGVRTYLLDGDNVRHGLTKDLGFTASDRIENVRRLGEVARLMVDAGLVVLVSCISSFREDRAAARRMVEAGEFCEVFVDTPLEVAERRDVKGLYAKARRGELKDFTGIDSPYEPPDMPEVHIDTMNTDPEAAADLIFTKLNDIGIV